MNCFMFDTGQIFEGSILINEIVTYSLCNSMKYFYNIEKNK